MEELRRAVDAVLAEDPHAFADVELGEQLVELRRQIDRLEGAFQARAAVFDANKVFVDDGHANTASWLRDRCRLSPGDASSRVRMARRLRDELDRTRDALAEGAVTLAQARVICEQAGKVADRLGGRGKVALKDAEPVFLQAAASLHPNDLGKVVRRWEQVVDPDGFLADANKAYDARYFNLSQSFDGMWRVDGLLDPESGATLAAAIRPLATPQGREDTRTPLSRRAHAARPAAAGFSGAPGGDGASSGGDPVASGDLPHPSVVAAPPTGPHVRRAGAGREGDLRVPAERSPAGGSPARARSGSGMPAGPGCWQPVLAGTEGCAWQGCDYPVEWTDAHHVHHWADGGPTNLDNLTLLCRRHHRAVHEGRQAVERPPPDR